LKHGNYPAETQARLLAIKYLLRLAWERPLVVKRTGPLFKWVSPSIRNFGFYRVRMGLLFGKISQKS
jgi:hypothetical protein